MSAHRSGLGAVALLGILVASAAPSPRPVMNHPARLAAAGPAGQLMVFGGRSADQMARGIGGKLDATLAELARQAGRARADHALEALHSMSPAAHFRQSTAGAGPMVAVDAVTRGDPEQLKAALVRLGLEHAAVFRNDVGGWLPVSAIEAAAARTELTSLRASLSRTRAVVATQGDFVQGTAALRATYSALDGTGVMVGVLSDSFDCYGVYAADQGQTVSGTVNGVSVSVPDPPASGPTGWASNGFTADAASDEAGGALPARVNVLAEVSGGGAGCVLTFGYPLLLPFADEGRAMLQIVHAIAPGASLAFYTADNSEADFANGIQSLANFGAKVIADDVGYFDEPFFQDGLVGEAIDTVNAGGVAYFAAAGNDGNLAYDNTAPQFSITGSGQQAGEMLLNFDTSNATQTSTLTVDTPSSGIQVGEFIAVIVQWDQPYVTGSPASPGATSQIDLCVSAPAGYSVLNPNTGNAATCTGANATGVDPVQILIVGVPANGVATTGSVPVTLSVGLAGGPAPGRIKVAWEDDGAGSTIATFAQPNAPTIQGHPNAAGAAAVGAAFFVNTPPCGLVPTAVVNSYSSLGGSPTLFDNNGNLLNPAVVRQKPDFVGPDGTNTTFFGFTLTSADDPSTVAGCRNDFSLPNYFGTSAATPHAAGLAALMLQANGVLTPAEVYTAIRNGAGAMDNPSPDFATGYGFIQAGAAMATLPAGSAVTVSPATITVGDTATVSWDGIDATSCTGSGSLSTSATSGTQSVTPAAAGSQTYTLSCTNAIGSSMSSATLTINPMPTGGAPPPSGGGGGGAVGELTLLALSGLLLLRLLLYPSSLRTSANTKPSRSTISPTRTAMGAANIGPADTTV